MDPREIKCTNCGNTFTVSKHTDTIICNSCGEEIVVDKDVKDETYYIPEGYEEYYVVSNTVKIFFYTAIFYCFISVIVLAGSYYNTIKEDYSPFIDKIPVSETTTTAPVVKDRYEFNEALERFRGQFNGGVVFNVINIVKTSNIENDKKISIILNGEELVDDNVILSVDDLYDIALEYDIDGYINKVIITRVM